MDETLKLQKLAAGRKKLKNHQQKKHSKKPDVESATALAEDPVGTTEVTEDNNKMQDSQTPQLQSYFTQPVANPVSFFDNVDANAPPPLVPPSAEAAPAESEAQCLEEDNRTYEDPELNADIIQEFVVHREEPLLPAHEQLRQLSDEIKEAIKSNGYDTERNNKTDNEKHNLELNSLYEKELQCETLTRQLEQYKSHVAQLEGQLDSIRVECDSKIRNNLGPLENEVQTHRQTIGILIGEKTELAGELSHCQLVLKQKSAECDELSARLKTSRSRVADIEKELGHLKEDQSRNSQVHSHYNSDVKKIQEELEKSNVHKVEMQEDLEEMRQRLKKMQDELVLTKQNQSETEAKLNMANLKIQQLTTGGDALETVVQEKLLLEKQIVDLNAACKVAIKERDQASNQYQQYVQQLNTNITSLAQKLESTVIENENMSRREQDLIKHMGEMEKRLQNLQQESANNICKHSNPNNNSAESTEKREEIVKEIAQLKDANERLEENFKAVANERDQFIEELENKKSTINELESLLEQVKSNQSNSAQLLASIESEKVAASRAVEQNLTLKQQLEEMQNAFVKMTNDKAELLTKLSSAEYKTREVEESTESLNHQLQTLTNAIEIKDRELTEIREANQGIAKEILQQNQLNDRLRHYEAQENSVHALQRQLQGANEEIRRLRKENVQENIAANNATESTETNKQSLEKSTNTQEEDALAPIDSQGMLNPSKEFAMQQLEKKFMRTMQQIANLQDEKQMLEHLVTQLQGETETIGEYIALYQHQRGVLKQRAMEKETQIDQLARDREQMKYQLNMLNNLVHKLVSQENSAISDEDLHQHKIIAKQTEALCEEHAKLHEEMQGDPRNETAQQIMNLLGEIKSSNLVQPTEGITDTFHPCPWCSGQLITV